MNLFKRFFLIFISICLFFNSAVAGLLTGENRNHSKRGSKEIKFFGTDTKTVDSDFELETIAEELEEELDGDDDFLDSFDIIANEIHQLVHVQFSNSNLLEQHENRRSKIPFFILFRNFRL